MDDEESDDNYALAVALHARWKGGEAKGRIEEEVWGDVTSHGRRFDRFIKNQLGVETTKPSRQTATIEQLQKQIKHLGAVPHGIECEPWELQLAQARSLAFEALRVWNDPTAAFRTGAFSLLFVAAWNGVLVGLLQRAGGDWVKRDDQGEAVLLGGVEQTLETMELAKVALEGEAVSERALIENLQFWVDLRNCVAHRFLPALDMPVIPQAQAGLMNLERVLRSAFGEEYALAERLTVPLQLSGFWDPGVLSSRKAMQSSLPLDVQAVLARVDELEPSISADPSFQMRVAFVPVVPASGRGADAVAYFVPPGEVPEELEQSIQRYVVLPKVWNNGRWFKATEVAAEVQRRTGFKFSAAPHHSTAAVRLGAKPSEGQDRTVDIALAEFVSSFNSYRYTQRWVDQLVRECSDGDAFERVTGRPAVRLEQDEEEP